MSQVRLILVGDDEALDVLSELARHLPLFELSRVDALPARVLDGNDVVVIGAAHVRTRDALLREAMTRGPVRHVAVVAQERRGDDAGARAILVAAELVRVLLPDTSGQGGA
jgi:hypothetical protein